MKRWIKIKYTLPDGLQCSRDGNLLLQGEVYMAEIVKGWAILEKNGATVSPWYWTPVSALELLARQAK